MFFFSLRLLSTLVLLIVGIAVIFTFIYLLKPKEESYIGIYVSDTPSQVYKHAAIVSDAPVCAKYGE